MRGKIHVFKGLYRQKPSNLFSIVGTKTHIYAGIHTHVNKDGGSGVEWGRFPLLNFFYSFEYMEEVVKRFMAFLSLTNLAPLTCFSLKKNRESEREFKNIQVCIFRLLVS